MIKFVTIFKRPPEMSGEQLRKWWLGDHARLSKKLPGLRKYVISLAFGPDDRLADGATEMWFDDLNVLKKALKSPEMAQVTQDYRKQKVSLFVEMWIDEIEQHLPHPKEPALGMAKFLSVLRRPPEMSLEDLHRWWLGGHAKLTREELPGVRKYIVNLAVGPRGDQVVWSAKGVECEGDGMAEMWFDDLAGLKNAINSSTMATLKKDVVEHKITAVVRLWTEEFPQQLGK